MEFDPELQGQHRFSYCLSLFPENPSSKREIPMTMFASETSPPITPSSPQPNNHLLFPGTNTRHIMNVPSSHSSHRYSTFAFVPVSAIASPCLDRPSLQARHSNGSLIRDLITPFTTAATFTPQKINASLHGGLNNTASAQVSCDFSLQPPLISTLVAADVVSSSSHPPSPPPISGGYGSMANRFGIEQELRGIRLENNQRANNGDGGTKRQYRRVKVEKDGNNTGNLIKKQWSPDEDRVLKELVEKHGPKWSLIAKFLNGRIGRQCRNRWSDHLHPDIKKGPWSLEEEIKLIEAHKEVGNKWREISKRLPGRTENCVKNNWFRTKRSLDMRFSDRSMLRAYMEEVNNIKKEKETSNKNKQKEIDVNLGLMLRLQFPTHRFSKTLGIINK